jgi:hypothetical protein
MYTWNVIFTRKRSSPQPDKTIHVLSLSLRQWLHHLIKVTYNTDTNNVCYSPALTALFLVRWILTDLVPTIFWLHLYPRSGKRKKRLQVWTRPFYQGTFGVRNSFSGKPLLIPFNDLAPRAWGSFICFPAPQYHQYSMEQRLASSWSFPYSNKHSQSLLFAGCLRKTRDTFISHTFPKWSSQAILQPLADRH